MSKPDKDDIDLESPLGLANEPIAQHPSDRLKAGDPSQRRSRSRALGEDGLDRESSGMGDVNVDPDGAAGIDMGYGGEGSGIDPKGSKP